MNAETDSLDCWDRSMADYSEEEENDVIKFMSEYAN
jgi:hypothetical protein